MDKAQISSAAQTLDDLLMYDGKGDCPVTRDEAERMWSAASELSGFAAVRAFLDVCKALSSKEPSNNA